MLKENKKYIDNEIDVIVSWLNGMQFHTTYQDYQHDIENVKSWVKQLSDTIDEFEGDEKNYNYESEEK